MSDEPVVYPVHWKNDHPHFFKYMTRKTAKAVLEGGTLRWSTPGTLNDPYDVQFDLHIEIDQEAVKARALDKLWNAFYGDDPVVVGNQLGAVIQLLRNVFPRVSRANFDKEFGQSFDDGIVAMKQYLPDAQQQMRAMMEDSKLLCLTLSPDNSLMWSHYAEQHKGIVIRLRSIPELDSAYGAARPVNYVANMPRLIDDDFLAAMASGQVSLNPNTILNRLVFTKSSEWEYEQEWRVFSVSGRTPGAHYEDLPFHFQELDAVIVGCLMSEEDRAEFSALTRKLYPHVSLLQAEKSAAEFKLEIAPLKI